MQCNLRSIHIGCFLTVLLTQNKGCFHLSPAQHNVGVFTAYSTYSLRLVDLLPFSFSSSSFSVPTGASVIGLNWLTGSPIIPALQWNTAELTRSGQGTHFTPIATVYLESSLDFVRFVWISCPGVGALAFHKYHIGTLHMILGVAWLKILHSFLNVICLYIPHCWWRDSFN